MHVVARRRGAQRRIVCTVCMLGIGKNSTHVFGWFPGLFQSRGVLGSWSSSICRTVNFDICFWFWPLCPGSLSSCGVTPSKHLLMYLSEKEPTWVPTHFGRRERDSLTVGWSDSTPAARLNLLLWFVRHIEVRNITSWGATLQTFTAEMLTRFRLK